MNVRELRKLLAKLPQDLPVMHPVGVCWIETETEPQVIEMRETYPGHWKPYRSSTKRPPDLKKVVAIGLLPDELEG